ncbi:MAG: hypothetical protein NT130_02815 [Candidatus Micrarchaeota archaeon]|nr:hypothetical protein [Candidatus Micrarchaeota archaeon]
MFGIYGFEGRIESGSMKVGLYILGFIIFLISLLSLLGSFRRIYEEKPEKKIEPEDKSITNKEYRIKLVEYELEEMRDHNRTQMNFLIAVFVSVMVFIVTVSHPIMQDSLNSRGWNSFFISALLFAFILIWFTADILGKIKKSLENREEEYNSKISEIRKVMKETEKKSKQV